MGKAIGAGAWEGRDGEREQ
uniref:Uncharacterized protein n=1 Tax=Anguilla anguilla TaxID=7936 RepID=A0A0E9T8S4_ANGAN